MEDRKEKTFARMDKTSMTEQQAAAGTNESQPTTDIDAQIEALRVFAHALNKMDDNGKRAAIYWLVDYFLGVKLWGWNSHDLRVWLRGAR